MNRILLTVASPMTNASPYNDTQHRVGDGLSVAPTRAFGQDRRLKMDHASTRCLQRSGPPGTRPCRRDKPSE